MFVKHLRNLPFLILYAGCYLGLCLEQSCLDSFLLPELKQIVPPSLSEEHKVGGGGFQHCGGGGRQAFLGLFTCSISDIKKKRQEAEIINDTGRRRGKIIMITALVTPNYQPKKNRYQKGSVL